MRFAWVVRPLVECDDEYSCDVVYTADEAGEADALAQTPDLEWFAAVRAEAFDAFAPGPVPAGALLEDGWRLACWGCDHEVGLDGCETCADAAGDDLSLPVTSGVRAWCSEACRVRDLASGRAVVE